MSGYSRTPGLWSLAIQSLKDKYCYLSGRWIHCLLVTGIISHWRTRRFQIHFDEVQTQNMIPAAAAEALHYSLLTGSGKERKKTVVKKAYTSTNSISGANISSNILHTQVILKILQYGT